MSAYNDLVALLNSNMNPPVTDSQKVADNDKAVLDFLLNQNDDDFPDWLSSLIFNTNGSGDGKYCKHPDTTGRKRIFETKTSSNSGNTPPIDPLITENTHWLELSQSSSGSIPEYTPGVFGTGLKIVFHNHSILGRGLYILTEAVRPFTSANIESETTAGQWQRFTVNNQELLDAVLGLYDDRGNYNASSNLFPSSGGSGTGGAILKGDIWTISTPGTLGGTPVIVGQTVRALVNTPAQVAGNWAISVGSATTPDASETVKGIAELAIQAESETAADSTLGNRDHTRILSARGFRWAWEVVKNLATTITGAWTFDGANTLITGYALTVRNSAAALIFRTRNDQSVEFGGSVMEIEVPAAVTAGNASINFNDLTGEQFGLKDKSSNKYLTFEKLASGTRIVRNRRAMVLDRGVGLEVYNDQVSIVTTTTAAAQNIVLSIAIPAGFMLSFKAYHMIAYATDESVVSADDLQVTAKNVSGTVTSASTTISHQRLPGTLNGSFNTNISGTDFQLRFQNESGTGKTYTVELDYTYTLIPKPI
jgi:hypothetical protein